MIRYYLKSNLRLFLFMLVLFVIINIALRTSWELKSSLDLTYVMFLYLMTCSIYGFYDYRVFKNKYDTLFQALKQGQNVDESFLTGDSFEENLLKNLIESFESINNRERNKYEEQIEEIDSYLVKWTHEIKLPISVCQLIVEDMDSDCTQPKKANDLRYEIERIKYNVQQVIYISRAAHYASDLILEEVDLTRVIHTVLRNYKGLFIHKNIAVNINVQGIVLSDEKWLAYVIGQLLHNAWKYSFENGEIHIWTEEESGKQVLFIRDNGTGIKEDEIKRVFEKGFTGSNGRNYSGSTGMGLYVVQKVLKILKHGIFIESREGEYTQIKIVFSNLSEETMLQKSHFN